MNTTTITRAHAATRRYLELKGFEVLEQDWAHADDSIDFIAADSGDLVFIETRVSMNAGTGIPEVPVDRAAFERLAAAYLAESDYVDCSIRFDMVSILVIGGDRALLRHCVNAIGSAEVG